jgi:rRNA methylases
VALRTRIEPETGVFIAESAAVIERAIAAGYQPFSVLTEDKWLERMQPILQEMQDVPVFVGDRGLLQEITGFHVHRGALALMRRPDLPSISEVMQGATR